MHIIIGLLILLYFFIKERITKEKSSKSDSRKTSSTINDLPKTAVQDIPPIPGQSRKTIQDEYFYLTGVDIEKEKQKWDERGKGYYGEYKIFEKLFFEVRGGCKFLMNLQIPTKFRKTTEIDLLMIHETGIYVFEVKHFKGTIYGKSNDKTWTQYFRTANNNYFNNPIHQNDYHIAALTDMLQEAKFLSIQKDCLNSIVVFTNENVDLRIENIRKDVLVTKSNKLIPLLNNKLMNKQQIWSVDEIDQIWRYLNQFSPVRPQNILSNDSDDVPLFQYIDALKLLLDKQEEKVSHWKDEFDKAARQYDQDLGFIKDKLEEEYRKRANALKTKSTILSWVTVVFGLLVILVSVIWYYT